MTYLAFDIETTGFKLYEGDKIFAYVTTDFEGNSDVRRLDGADSRKNKLHLQRLLKDKNIAFVAHNAKFEMSFLVNEGYKGVFEKEWHDTMIQHQMLRNLNKKHSLDFLAKKYFGYDCPEDLIVETETKKMQRLNRKNNPDQRINLSFYDKIDKKVMTRYQIADGERCIILHNLMLPKLKKDKLMYKDYLNEIELLKVAVRQERKGLAFNIKRADKYKEKLETQCIEYEKIVNSYGFTGNLRSDIEVGNFLFTELKLPNDGKTKKGRFKVQKNFLIEMYEKKVHPILEPLIRYRTNSSGISIIEGYKDLVNPKTGIIHPTVNTNKASTGRQSVSNPSLQNVSSQTVEDSLHGIKARGLFFAEKGEVLILIDYAGIEFRLIVDACNEEEFIEIINTGGNVHDVVAEFMYRDKWNLINLLCESPRGVKIPDWILGIDEGRKENYKILKKMMRGGIKNFNFGVPYGGSINAVTNSLVGLTKREKNDAHKRYSIKWPKVFNFSADTSTEVKKNGYIKTAFGRKLYVEKGFEYQGANYKIQGTAAGILKRAEVRLDNYFINELNGNIEQNLTVHDELIMSWKRKILRDMPKIMGRIKKIMTTHEEIKVKLDVEAKITNSSWADAKPLDIERF